MKKRFFYLLASILVASGAYAQQDKSELEKERKDIQREISELQGMYDKAKGQTRKTLGQLNLINRKINLQEQYIGSINREIRNIEDNIYLSNLEIYRLQRQVDTLKAQYAKTVVYAYKNRSDYDYLNFIFSANSFNDAVRRINYLKSYRAYREKQVSVILETQQLISQRQKQQLVRKDQKGQAITNHTKQVQELAVQKKERDQEFSNAKSQEKDLKNQIAAKKKKDRDLQNAITAIVRREIEAAKAKAKAEAEAKKAADDAAAKANAPRTNPTTSTTSGNTNNATTSTTTPTARGTSNKPTSYLDLNANDVALNNKFELNRGKLPWPVDNGVVTLNFGKNKIDNTLLTFDNPGITIATPSSGVTVKTIFDGEVSGVYNLGDGMAVTVRHGKYFTTYSNLSSVSVSKGTQVKTGQALGKAGRGEDGSGGQVDLILMIETRNVDPKPWLRR
jgi:septal ring factor EnvC (AmiA/AmiB activator)